MSESLLKLVSMAGGGPRDHGVGSALAEIVMANQGGNKVRMEMDRQNAGMSGTALWKLKEDNSNVLRKETSITTPDGFVHQEGPWYYHPDRKVFRNEDSNKLYFVDVVTKEMKEIYEAQSHEGMLRITADSVSQDGSQTKQVMVKDLIKAGRALKMPLDHLDKPCALFALYDGHRSGGGTSPCLEFCAKQFHMKLIPKLTAYEGYWDTDRTSQALQESFEELDADFLDKHPAASDGCSAAIVLVIGLRVFVAGLGGVGSVLCLEGYQMHDVIPRHVPSYSSEADRVKLAGGEVFYVDGVASFKQRGAEESKGSTRWTRAFGDRDFKVPSDGKEALVSAAPKVRVLQLEREHRSVMLMSDSLSGQVQLGTDSETLANLVRGTMNRPRMACRKTIDHVEKAQKSTQGLAVVTISFDHKDRSVGASASDGGPPAKRSRVEPSSVRCRQLLVKFADCKNNVDKVRRRKVTRTRAEAEMRLIEEVPLLEGDPEGWPARFGKLCRDLSECTTSLKGGDMAGDLGWMTRGQKSKHPACLEDAAFALDLGELSDIIVTDEGAHLLWRTA